MPEQNTVKKQLDRLNGQIHEINNELAKIDSSEVIDDGLQQLVKLRQQKLERRVKFLNQQRDRLLILQTNESIGFNSKQQRVVNEINFDFASKYEGQLESLKQMDNINKRQFFDTYALADTTLLQETLLKTFFGYSN